MAPQVTDFSFWNEMWKQSYYDREKGIRANPLLEYWDKRANDFSLMRKSNDYDFGRKVYAALSSVLNPDSTMLDIGAGPGSFTIPFISLVLWMFPDVWPRLLQMEQYSKGYCAIVAGIPDWKNPREASKSDVQEFQILYNMLISQGRSPNVSIIDYRCERTVDDEIECRKIIYEQYYGDLTPEAEEQIKKEIIAKSKDNKCLISSRSAIIWWNPKEVVSHT